MVAGDWLDLDGAPSRDVQETGTVHTGFGRMLAEVSQRGENEKAEPMNDPALV